MQEIKKGWKKVRFSDHIKIMDGDRGKNYPKGNEFFDDGFCLFLNTKNVPNNNFSFEENIFITEEKDNLLRKGKIQRLDYVFTTRGTVGNFAYYSDKITYDNIRINSGMVILRIQDNNLISNDYLKFILDSKGFKEDVKLFSSGTAQPQLPIRDMSKIEILLPPLPTQQKIASILSKYDDLIENNNKRIKILEETAQSIYEEWFVKYNFPGSENIKMIESGNDDFGIIPEGWELKTVGESFTTVLGGTPSRIKEEFWGGNIPWINSGKVNDLMIINESEFITELGYSKSSTKLMPKGTTVIAITGATLGQVSILGIEACANQSVIGIYDETGFFSNYIYYFFMNNINRIISHAGGGAQQHINKDIVNQIKVIIPKNEILENFNINTGVIIDEMKNLFFKNRNLKETRDLLIPRLVSGELDVESLDVK